MANANSTATTHEELAEQFPTTNRPFAVWYHQESDDNLRWCVNDDSGHATKEFAELATALKAAAEMGKDWAEEARIQAQALARVTGDTIADFIQSASDYCDNMNAFFELAEREIKENNNTDFDGMKFLVKGAKTELFRFSILVCETQGESAVHHA